MITYGQRRGIRVNHRLVEHSCNSAHLLHGLHITGYIDRHKGQIPGLRIDLDGVTAYCPGNSHVLVPLFWCDDQLINGHIVLGIAPEIADCQKEHSHRDHNSANNELVNPEAVLLFG